MIQRILTALVLIPLVLLLILRAPRWALTGVAAIVALLAIREFLNLAKRYNVEPFSIATYIFAGILLVSVGDAGLALTFLAGLAPFVFLAIGLRRESISSIYPAAAASVFAVAYIAIPMKLLAQLSPFHLIYLMIVVWSGDVFAYFVGKSVGRYKMAPRISPGKTWEGAAASWLASAGFGTLFYTHSQEIASWLYRCHLLRPGAYWSDIHRAPLSPLWVGVLLSSLLNVAAQLGDLVESAIKRGADVKDSGSILPGHGGMLDRIDALLFAAPVLWWYSVSVFFLYSVRYAIA